MQALKNLSAYLAVGMVIGFAAVLLFYNLGGPLLNLYDEGTYAQVVDESAQRADFLTFTYGGKSFFDKPPLYFWLAALVRPVVHDRALMIRLPAALSALGVVGVTMLLIYAFSQSVWVAAFGGFLLIKTQAFIDGAREARLDLLVSLCILLCVYVFLRAQKNEVWFLFVGPLLALAFLSKSVIALFAGVVIIALAAVLKDFSWLKNKYFWWGTLLGLLVVLPWHIYESFRFGAEFWRQYIGYHVLERYEKNLFYSPELQAEYLFHLKLFAPLLFYTFVGALLALPITIRRLPMAARAGLVASIVAVLAMAGVFFTAETRAFSYLLPLYPFAAIAVALSVRALKNP